MSRYEAYAEYKYSGVEWLGLVPQHWNTRQLKFLCTCNDEVLGDSIHPEYEIKYIDIGSVSASEGISKTETMPFSGAPSRARRIVRDGDVIISTVRTYLEAIASIDNPPPNLIVSTGFAVIRPNQHLHKRFAAYCLRTSGFIKEVIARSVGVSYPAINASDLIDIKTPLPHLNEQEKIANFLDHETAKIDTLIAKQQGLIKLLKEKRQAVISHAVTIGLNPNAPMRDSGVEWLGEVPSHWVVSNMAFALNAIGDLDHYMPESIEKGIPYVMTGDLKELTSSINFDDCKQVSNGDYLALSKKIKSSSGDVIMARYATVGAVSYIDIDAEFLISYSCVTIKPNPLKAIGLYLFYFFKSDAFLQGIQSQINTNTQGNVGVNDLKKIKVALPPLTEQLDIIEYLQSRLLKFDVVSDKSEAAIRWSKERRTALISAAVTGKIDVRDWQPAPVPELEDAAA